MPILLAADAVPTALDQFLQHCLIGLTLGSIFALIALGYTMVYGIIELINFAHGDVFMLGTMASLTLIQLFFLTPTTSAASMVPLLLLTLVAAMELSAVLIAAVESVAYRQVRREPRLAPLITAIGVSFILANLGLHWKGASYVTFPSLIPSVDILRDVFGVESVVSLTTKDIFVVGVTFPLLFGLNWFVQ